MEVAFVDASRPTCHHSCSNLQKNGLLGEFVQHLSRLQRKKQGQRKDHTNTAQHCTVFVWFLPCLLFCAKVYLLRCSTFNVLCQASALKGYLRCITERIERIKRQGTVLSATPLLGTHWQVEGKEISKHSTHIPLKDSNPFQHVAWFQGKAFQGPLKDCT